MSQLAGPVSSSDTRPSHLGTISLGLRPSGRRNQQDQNSFWRPTMREFLAISLLGFLMLLGTCAQAQDLSSFERALRKVARSEQARQRSEQAEVLGGSFVGRWSGRFSFLPSSSTCSTSVTSISFRHLMQLRGRSATLTTNHSGFFLGGSRDGLTYIFTKLVNTSSGTFAGGVAYSSLSSDGRRAIVVFLVQHISSGCEFAYGTRATR